MARMRRCRACNKRIWPWQAWAGSSAPRVGWAHLTDACFTNPKGNAWQLLIEDEQEDEHYGRWPWT